MLNAQDLYHVYMSSGDIWLLSEPQMKSVKASYDSPYTYVVILTSAQRIKRDDSSAAVAFNGLLFTREIVAVEAPEKASLGLLQDGWPAAAAS